SGTASLLGAIRYCRTGNNGDREHHHSNCCRVDDFTEWFGLSDQSIDDGLCWRSRLRDRGYCNSVLVLRLYFDPRCGDQAELGRSKGKMTSVLERILRQEEHTDTSVQRRMTR